MPWQTAWGYQMWPCDKCGCLGIATELDKCPHCGKKRPKMPKITSSGNNVPADQADTPQDVSLAAPKGNAPKDEWVRYAVAQGENQAVAEGRSRDDLIKQYGAKSDAGASEPEVPEPGRQDEPGAEPVGVSEPEGTSEPVGEPQPADTPETVGEPHPPEEGE